MVNDNAFNEMGLSPFQEKIFKILQESREAIGLSEQQILEKFPKIQHRDVMYVLFFELLFVINRI